MQDAKLYIEKYTNSLRNVYLFKAITGYFGMISFSGDIFFFIITFFHLYSKLYALLLYYHKMYLKFL